MESKNYILAIVLSVAVFFAYQMLFPPPRPQPVKPQAPAAGVPVAPEKKTVSSSEDLSDLFAGKTPPEQTQAPVTAVSQDIRDLQEKKITVETDRYIATFTNQGVGLTSFVLKNYKDDKGKDLNLVSESVNIHKLYPFYFSTFEGIDAAKKLNNERFLFEGASNIVVTGNVPRTLVFKFADSAQKLMAVKKFTFQNGSYVLSVSCDVVKDGAALDLPVIFGPGLENNINPERVSDTMLKIRCYNGQDFMETVFGKVKTEKTADNKYEIKRGEIGSLFYWTSYENNYFAVLFKNIQNKGKIAYAFVKTPGEKKGPGQFAYVEVSNLEKVYLGPKSEKELDHVKDIFLDAPKVIDYGWTFFGWFAKILLVAMNFVHGWIPNYGWALVVVTILLKIVMFPLTYTSSVSMAKMQALQPKLKAIRKKYRNLRDPEQRRQMNVETMTLYKQERVNPASGCLPLLLQMPILIGFFQLLRTTIDVRHEPWIFWIRDLSLKDPSYLLPILMGVTQIVVTKMTPSTGEGSQKMMMYIMPVVMVFLFMNFASGLNLYWFISNLLQIGQQHIINKKIFSEKKEEEREKKILKRKKGVKAI